MMRNFLRTVVKKWTNCFQTYLSLLFFVAIFEAQGSENFSLKAVDEIIENNLAKQVPGGVVVILEDKNSHVIPFGLRNAEQKAVVKKDSAFGMASITKMFSGSLAAVLEKKEIIDFNQAISEFLPSLELENLDWQQQVTFHHLLSHTSGLPRHDFAWLNRTMESDQFYKTLKHLPFALEPSSQWIYSNLGYYLFGKSLEENNLTNNWYTELYLNILHPLELKVYRDCSITPEEDLAFPHAYNQEMSGFSPLDQLDGLGFMAPAGSLCISGNSMASWLRFHLGQGLSKEQEALRQTIVAKLHQPLVEISDSPRYKYYSYGLIKAEENDTSVFWHNGGVSGYQSFMAFDLEKQVAAAVLVNANSASLDEIGFQLMKILGSYISPDQVAEPEIITHTLTPPLNPLQTFSGKYYHPGYGNVRVIANEDNTLSISLNDWLEVKLNHIGDQVFSLERLAKTYQHLYTVQFGENNLKWQLEVMVPPIAFIKE